MSAEQRQRAHDRTAALLEELPLHALRQARQLTQESLAKTLGSQQALVSKLERRADMYVSTLRRYIEALGGQLEIVAHFADASVRIAQFSDIPNSLRTAKKSRS